MTEDKVNNDLYKLIFENSSAAIALLGKDTKIEIVNDAFCEISGYYREELIGEKWTEKMPANEVERLKNYNRARLQNPKNAPKEYETTFHNKLGELRVCLISASIIESKKLTIVTIIDVSEKKRVEKALAESNYLINESQKAGFIGSYKANFKSQTWESSEILDDIFGIDKAYDRSIEPGWTSLLHPDDKETMVDYLFNEVIGHNKPFRAEYRIVRKNDKEIRWVNTLGKISVDENNQVESLIGTVQDITERKNAEKELKEREAKLHELNVMKDKFLSIIAHDLINPIGSISGLSEILVKRIEENDAEKIKKLAIAMQNSSRLVLDLLMNLLEWSRSETGRIDYSPEVFNIKQYVSDVILLFALTAKQKEITIIKDIPNDLEVYADRLMLSTVLRNLLSNAIKFSNTKSTVNFTIESREVDILFKISDSGVGIPESTIEKLFRIDENISTTGTNEEKGTGLGLILCKEFIERHGGKIWIKSEIGKGSEFYFTIPFKK